MCENAGGFAAERERSRPASAGASPLANGKFVDALEGKVKRKQCPEPIVKVGV